MAQCIRYCFGQSAAARGESRQGDEEASRAGMCLRAKRGGLRADAILLRGPMAQHV